MTNGILLKEKLAEKIAKHVSQVHVSLNAATKTTYERIIRGSTWERVLRNVHLLRAAREHFDTNLQIKGHMTLVPQNVHEIRVFITKFQKLVT